MKFFRWFINRINDWAEETIKQSENEERRMAHMFDRLWESRQRELDKK